MFADVNQHALAGLTIKGGINRDLTVSGHAFITFDFDQKGRCKVDAAIRGGQPVLTRDIDDVALSSVIFMNRLN